MPFNIFSGLFVVNFILICIDSLGNTKLKQLLLLGLYNTLKFGEKICSYDLSIFAPEMLNRDTFVAGDMRPVDLNGCSLYD